MFNENYLSPGFIQTCVENRDLSNWLLNFFEQNQLSKLKEIVWNWRNGWGDYAKDWRDGWGNHEKS